MSNKLQLTMAKLNEAKTLSALAEMPEVRHNAIQNIVNTQGISPERAMMYYERERIMFAQLKLDDCETFSKYTAWIQLLVSGGSLNDGDSYIMKMGKKAVFIPGWKARLRMMGEIPEIVTIPPPQVVGENDAFEYEFEHAATGPNDDGRPRIIKHVPSKGDRGKLTHVYLVITKKSGKELHIMDREQVLAVRDRYSKSYQQYIADCKAGNHQIGSTFKKSVGQYDITVEPPMWVSSEQAAWKKTIVKRAWDAQQNKSAKMRKLPPTSPEAEEDVEEINYDVLDDSTGEMKTISSEQAEPATNIARSQQAEPAQQPERPTPAIENTLDAF